MNLFPKSLFVIVAASLLVACEDEPSQAADASHTDQAPTLVVYSERKEHLIKPLFERYTQQTGVPIQYINDSAAVLAERLVAEGEATPADLLLTVDAGNLWQAKQRGVLAVVDSDLLRQRVPAALRDPDNQWFGLSQRARTIVYSTDRVDPSELSSYEALADSAWAGRLCLRTSKKVYNQSLVALIIERLGAAATEQVVSGWVANLAAPVFSSDSRLLEAIAAGQCDVGIVNTYYLGRIVAERPEFPVSVFWPNQDDLGGVHVNVAGGAITQHAPNREAAISLLLWLASADAQRDFAGLNLEYPVNPAVAAHDMLKAWGDFKADPTNLAIAGQRQREAVQLMDRAGYQ